MLPVACTEIKLGCVMVTDLETVHPLESVTVTVYVPALMLFIVAEVAPVFHRYEYDGVPPLAVTDADAVPP